MLSSCGAPANIRVLMECKQQRHPLQARADGSFGGCGFASDESPPSSNRFKGMRFQVTHLYMCFFPDEHTWEACTDSYPMRVERHLCDIMHVPGKTGAITLKVIEQQLASKGCFRPDICSGVGDGGGENEGCSGVHNLLRVDNSSYVSKRCMGHMPWTVAKAGLNELGYLHDATNSVCVYLRDGTTWPRLKAIATMDANLGGLNWFREGSRAYHSLFGIQPPNIIEDRPETFAQFVKWLLPRQRLLAQLTNHDLASRTLEMKSASIAMTTLNCLDHCTQRHVLYVMLEKSLYLYYYIKEKRYISEHDDFTELMDRAAHIITSLELDARTMDILGVTETDVTGLGLGDRVKMNWVEFCVNLNCLEMFDNDHDRVDAMVCKCVKIHQLISVRMATHLSLTARTINNASWIAARMLSKNPDQAKNGGRAFRDHVVRLRAGRMTEFERHFTNDEVLMQELADFADYPHPVLLWQCGAKFKTLYKFLAIRFLVVPDSVLDEEGVHAKWKWLELMKRSMKFTFLNASLKLQEYLVQFTALPTGADLEPHMKIVRDTLALQYRAALADPEIAPAELRNEQMRDRFGMRGVDVELLKEKVNRPDVVQTPASAFGMYVRFLFEPHKMYCFTRLNTCRFLFIAENKSLPNRDEVQAGDATGRPLSVVWCAPAEPDDDADVTRVVPIAGEDGGKLEILHSTVAEISLAAGYYPDVGTSDSAREVEWKHECALLNHDIFVYDARRCTYNDGDEWGASWSWILDEPGTDIEEHAWGTRDISSLTKMALARQLQLRDMLSDDQRGRIWGLSKDVLLAAILDPTVNVLGPAPKAKAKAKPKAKAGPAPKAKAKAKPKAAAVGKAKAAGGGGARGGRGRGGRGGRG